MKYKYFCLFLVIHIISLFFIINANDNITINEENHIEIKKGLSNANIFISGFKQNERLKRSLEFVQRNRKIIITSLTIAIAMGIIFYNREKLKEPFIKPQLSEAGAEGERKNKQEKEERKKQSYKNTIQSNIREIESNCDRQWSDFLSREKKVKGELSNLASIIEKGKRLGMSEESYYKTASENYTKKLRELNALNLEEPELKKRLANEQEKIRQLTLEIEKLSK